MNINIINSKKIYKYNSLYHKNFNFYDTFLKILTIFSSVIIITIFLSFIGYIVLNGASYINLKFITADKGCTKNGIAGIIINTLYVQILTILISTPIGVGSAIYLTQYKKQGKIIELINFLTNMLASIPSILFGLFGYNIFCVAFGGTPSIIIGCLTLCLCILPTIISTTKEAILAVPLSYSEGALALGAGKLKVILSLILPCAMPGIATAIILAAGKIIGESAALLLTVGTKTTMPSSFFGHIFKGGRTLTLHLYFTAGNATDKDSIKICFAIATILIFLIFVLNSLTKLLAKIFKK